MKVKCLLKAETQKQELHIDRQGSGPALLPVAPFVFPELHPGAEFP